jgi:hypothetical protein
MSPATLIVSVDVPVPPVMLDVLNVGLGPVGDPVAVRVTVPVKPFEDVMVIVDLSELPA